VDRENFDILIGRIDGQLHRLIVPEVYPLYADYLNYFCGLKPAEWIGNQSYHRAIIFTRQLREQLFEIINRHSETFPDGKDLMTFFNGIEDNTPFFFLRLGVPMPKTILASGYTVLSKLYKQLCYSSVSYGYTAEKTFIGHQVYSERVCRFCGKKHPEVRFKDENAHAIPEGLGNKILFCYDECTNCNNRLNNNFEKDFVVYLDVRRTSAATKGKKKIPTVYGHNYKIEGKTQQLSISKYAILEETDELYHIKLEGCKEIFHLNIYKALIKFVVDLSDEKILPQFQTAVDWLNDKFLPPQVPDVRLCYHSHEDSVIQPRIRIYVRKDGLSYKSGPYCIAELDVLDLTFVYLIPFVPEDKGHFLSKVEANPYLCRFIESSDVLSFNPENIDMTDRQGKFSHVKEWVRKDSVKIVPHEVFVKLQERKKDLIDFPDIDKIKINISNVSIALQSEYKNNELTYDKSKITSSCKVKALNNKSIEVSGTIGIAPTHEAISGLTLSYNAVCQSQNCNEIFGIAKDQKGELVAECNGMAILRTLEFVVKRMSLLYSDKLPSFDFERLPDAIMEQIGIIIHPNEDAEKTIMPV